MERHEITRYSDYVGLFWPCFGVILTYVVYPGTSVTRACMFWVHPPPALALPFCHILMYLTPPCKQSIEQLMEYNVFWPHICIMLGTKLIHTVFGQCRKHFAFVFEFILYVSLCLTWPPFSDVSTPQRWVIYLKSTTKILCQDLYTLVTRFTQVCLLSYPGSL